VAGKFGIAASTGTNGLGERVRAARKELGLSQAQLAGDELTKGFISQLESGLVRPSIRSLQLIATRLGKPLDYFLGDERLETGKRVAFHRLAAEAAAEQRDWAGVTEHVQQALEAGPEPAERAALLYLLGRAEAAGRRFERVFELVSEALGLVKTDSDPQLVAQLLSQRGFAYSQIDQVTAATESYEAARDIIERYELVDPRLRARVCISLGAMYRSLGRVSKAVAAYETALTMATRISANELAARVFMGIAVTHYDSGELDAAVAAYRRALDLFQRISDTDFELSALQSIATIQLESGDVATAKSSAERVMSRSIEVGNTHWAGVAEVILSRIALREGRTEEALRKAQHAEQILGEIGDKVNQADARGAMGAAYEAMGLVNEADAAYRASLDLYTSVNDLADRSGMAAEYAKVLRARGEVDKAFEMLELARTGTSAR
jgi:tetratricopeptide (TPR) repeat protein